MDFLEEINAALKGINEIVFHEFWNPLIPGDGGLLRYSTFSTRVARYRTYYGESSCKLYINPSDRFIFVSQFVLYFWEAPRIKSGFIEFYGYDGIISGVIPVF